jgi:hypothetical protein
VQTNPNWELHIIHDGEFPSDDLDIITEEPFEDKRIKLYNSKTRLQNYGHPNRKQMLNRIEANSDDFILLTNDDNYYTPNFVAQVLSNATKTVGLIYWNMLNRDCYDMLDTKLAVSNIDMGAFAVRADVAKTVGFNSTKYEADGIYCVECKKYCESKRLRTLKVKGILFIHN